MTRGWISLDRKIQEHWVWEDKPFAKGQAWTDLLMMANHEDKKVSLGNEIITVKRGSRVTSMGKLASRWGWSRKKVYSFLNQLESDRMIERKSDTKKTVVTIVNYDDYQRVRNAKETPKKRKGNATETRRNTNNNDKQLITMKNKKDILPSATNEVSDLPEGAEILPDGTISYANVKREW